MNLITIIDGLAPYQFVRAEELSESVIQSDHVGAEWLVPDSGEEVPLHVFPVVGGFGMYCSKCHGFYPKEICVHTAAAFLSARSWMCDEMDDDTGYEHIIRGNIGELRSILSQGTEYFGCLYASKEIGEVVDRDVCMEFAGTIVGRALRLMDRIYLEISRCVESERLRERMFVDVRDVAFGQHIFGKHVSTHWSELESIGDEALFYRRT